MTQVLVVKLQPTYTQNMEYYGPFISYTEGVEQYLDKRQIITLFVSVKELSALRHTLDMEPVFIYGTDVCSLQVQVMSGSHSTIQDTKTTVL